LQLKCHSKEIFKLFTRGRGRMREMEDEREKNRGKKNTRMRKFMMTSS
jgi:hypothetical protein